MGKWLMLAAVVAAGCGSRAEPEPLWVGHVALLSGPESARGESARRGILLAVEGGDTPVGRQLRRLMVRHADGARDARAQSVRLLAVNRVVALVAWPDSATAAAAAWAAAPSGGGLLVAGEVPVELVQEGVHTLGVPAADRGRALAKYARAQKWRRAAVLLDAGEPLAVELATAFRRAWPSAGGHALAEWPAARALVMARLGPWKPDVILVACAPRNFAARVTEVRGAGLRIPVLYGGEDAGAERLARDLPVERDVYLGTGFARSGLTAEGKKFATRFRDRFREPPDLDAAQAYDAMRLLRQALGQAEGPRRDQVGAALDKLTSFDSVTGPVRWQVWRPQRRLFVVRLQAGESSTVQTLAPQ
jgi:branched-chain amino acid transport system substrate-binding protein